MAQEVEHRTVMWEVAGSNPGRNNTQDLKITEEKVLPLKFHLQMVRISSLLGIRTINHRPHLTNSCIFYVHKFPVKL